MSSLLGSLRLEYNDVQAVIDKGRQEVGWVQQELGGVTLGDKRLDRRLITTAEHLASSPLSPINEACGNLLFRQVCLTRSA